MMPGVDMNKVLLRMGMTHPVLGPINTAWLWTNVSMAMSYSAYMRWMQLLFGSAALGIAPPETKKPDRA